MNFNPIITLTLCFWKWCFFLFPRVWQLNWDTKPNFKPDSKSLLWGLSNEFSSVSEFQWKHVQNYQNVILKISYAVIYVCPDTFNIHTYTITNHLTVQEALNIWSGKLFHFFKISYNHIYPKVIVIAIVNLQKKHDFAKFGGCCSKNAPVTPLRSLKWSKVWQAYFLSYHFHI